MFHATAERHHRYPPLGAGGSHCRAGARARGLVEHDGGDVRLGGEQIAGRVLGATTAAATLFWVEPGVLSAVNGPVARPARKRCAERDAEDMGVGNDDGHGSRVVRP